MNCRKYSTEHRQPCTVPLLLLQRTAASVIWRSDQGKVKCLQNLLGKSEGKDLGFAMEERGLKLPEMGRAVVSTVTNIGLHKMRAAGELLLSSLELVS